jgi:hypothetical protein
MLSTSRHYLSRPGNLGGEFSGSHDASGDGFTVLSTTVSQEIPGQLLHSHTGHMVEVTGIEKVH